eukprot:757877-Amphidinium_carterae.1
MPFEETVTVKYLAKNEVCGINVNHQGRRCVDAVQDRLVQILLAKYLYQAFVVPAFRICAERPMKLQDAGVLLVCVWLDSLMLGPCIPLLFPEFLILAAVHTELLFGGFQLLRTEEKEGHNVHFGDLADVLPPVGKTF